VGGEEKTVYGQVEEATLTSLRPATSYHIRLFAENELGRSKEGRVIQVQMDYFQNLEYFRQAAQQPIAAL
jgi:hypothetical protein